MPKRPSRDKTHFVAKHNAFRAACGQDIPLQPVRRPRQGDVRPVQAHQDLPQGEVMDPAVCRTCGALMVPDGCGQCLSCQNDGLRNEAERLKGILAEERITSGAYDQDRKAAWLERDLAQEAMLKLGDSLNECDKTIERLKAELGAAQFVASERVRRSILRHVDATIGVVQECYSDNVVHLFHDLREGIRAHLDEIDP